MSRPQPVRVYFVSDDPASLWRRGQTADDLGPEYPGSPHHVFRLDHFDESLVVLEDPYGRGLVAPIGEASVSPRSTDEPAERRHMTVQDWDELLDRHLDLGEDLPPFEDEAG